MRIFRDGSALRLALAAATVALGTDAAPAATLKPESGLDGIVRVEMNGATQAGPEAEGLVLVGHAKAQNDATDVSAAPEGRSGHILMAAGGGAKPSRAAGASGGRPEAPTEGSGKAPAGASPDKAAGGTPHALSGRAGGMREAGPMAQPGEIGPFGGLRAFARTGPCHWRYRSFAAAENRNRCGYPAIVGAPAGPAPTVRFAGSIGGGSSRGAAPAESPAGPGPNTPGRPGGPLPLPTDPIGQPIPTTPTRPTQPNPPPVVQPVPVPPAWILIATAAAPLVMRRRRK